MAGVKLLSVSDNPAREIAERAPRQLEDSERIQRVIIVVIIIEREFLILVQDLVKAQLELIRSICGFNHVLNLGTGAPRPRHELHQAVRYGIKALGWNGRGEILRAGRCGKNGIPRLACVGLAVAIDDGRERRLTSRRKLASTAILENRREGVRPR